MPDAMLEIADEVELIDLTPQMLRQRMREGKIYAADKIEQALSAFFTTSNLIALREFALRELADDVDERLEAWDRSSSLRGPLRRQEVIVVGLSSPLHAERLIRRGFRIAHRLKAEWQVVLAGNGTGREKEEQRSVTLEQLTERLGGRFVKLYGTGRSKGRTERFVEAADKVNATQLIVGREACGRGIKGWLTAWSDYRSTRKLLRLARHMDLLIAAP